MATVKESQKMEKLRHKGDGIWSILFMAEFHFTPFLYDKGAKMMTEQSSNPNYQKTKKSSN